MADFDPSGGGSEWIDVGSALTPTGDETIGDGTDNADLESLSTKESRTGTRTVTINVPTDFNTVAAAIDEVSRLRRSPGLLFEINIESGHAIDKQIIVEDSDLRHVTITSEDQMVPNSATLTSTPPGQGLLNVTDSISPTWDIRLQGGSSINAIFGRGSVIRVATGAGSEFCNRGVSAAGGSILLSNGADWSNNDQRGASVTNGSRGYLGNADLSQNGIGVRVGASFVQMEDAITTTCNTGIRATDGAKVDAATVDASGCADHAVSAQSLAEVNFRGGDAAGPNNGQEIYIRDGSVVMAVGSNTTNGGPNVSDVNISALNSINGVEGIVWG